MNLNLITSTAVLFLAPLGVMQPTLANAQQIVGEKPLWSVSAPTARFHKAEGGTVQLAGVTEGNLDIFSWVLPPEFVSSVAVSDQPSSTTNEIWTKTASVPVDFQFTQTTQTTDSLYFWDKTSKELRWADWSTPEAGFQSTALQFNELDDVADRGDLIFALGTLNSDVTLIIGKKSELTSGGNWIVPGPLPDARRGASIEIIDDQNLILVGGSITNQNGTTIFPQNQLISAYNDTPGLSLLKNHPFPILASAESKVILSNDVLGVLDASPDAPGLMRIQFAYTKPSGEVGVWTTGHYSGIFENGDCFTDETLHRLYHFSFMPAKNSSRVLTAYNLPQSRLLLKKQAEEARATLKKVSYVYLSTALKRAANNQNAVFLVVPGEGDSVREQFETVYRDHNVFTMMEDVILAQADQNEIAEIMNRFSSTQEKPLFILLSSEGEVISSRSEPITDRSQIFELLKPLWEPVGVETN